MLYFSEKNYIIIPMYLTPSLINCKRCIKTCGNISTHKGHYNTDI